MKKLSILAATAAAFAMVAGSAALAQGSTQQPARIGDKPNLNGVWQVLNNANWNLEPQSAGPSIAGPAADRLLGTMAAAPASLGVIEGGTIPYRPDALERLQRNRDNLVQHDPEAACYLPGIPRATYMPFPFQIVQGDNDDILMVYEYATANRVIEMRDVDIPPIDTWMGTSYGRWDGDTLVVVTLAQSPGEYKAPGGLMISDSVTWLDRAGNFLTHTATVTERFTKVGDNHIQYSATIDDPEIYTRPWTISMPLYRRMEPNAQLLEFRCVPFSELMLYGDLLEDSPPSE